MSVIILFGFGDDLNLDQRAEVHGGLCLGEGDEDFRLVDGYSLRAIERREKGVQDVWRTLRGIQFTQQIGDAISSHYACI